eukprot:361284-Chlamydomonas_euryale.AAC.1
MVSGVGHNALWQAPARRHRHPLQHQQRGSSCFRSASSHTSVHPVSSPLPNAYAKVRSPAAVSYLRCHQAPIPSGAHLHVAVGHERCADRYAMCRARIRMLEGCSGKKTLHAVSNYIVGKL